MRLRRTPAPQSSLSCGSMPARLHSMISVLTYSGHVFLGLPFPLGLGSSKSVTDLIEDVAHYMSIQSQPPTVKD